MRVIYIDVLFLQNLIINYLLLLATMHISGVYAKRYRLFLSALAGSIYCVLIFIPSLSFFYTAGIKLLAGAFLIIIAFYKKSFYILLKLYLVLLGLSAALAGGILAFYWILKPGGALIGIKNGIIYADISSKTLLISVFICCLFFSLFLRRSGETKVLEKEVKPAEITLFGRKTILFTLIDTGNELRDPITGKRVLIAEYDAIRDCLPDRLRESFEFGKTLDASLVFELAVKKGYAGALRLLPYKTISGGRMMIVLKPEKVMIDQKPVGDIIIGLSFEGLKDANGYSALVGV